MTAVEPIRVVTTQPAGNKKRYYQHNIGRPWTTGICECTEDVMSCYYVLFCGTCYVCKIAENMGENCCVPLCVPGAMVAMRTKLRTMHDIEAVCCSDGVTCCPSGTIRNSETGNCDSQDGSSVAFLRTSTRGKKQEKFWQRQRLAIDVCDDNHYCLTGSTCCRRLNGLWGCCPIPSAVCCADNINCCPRGFT